MPDIFVAPEDQEEQNHHPHQKPTAGNDQQVEKRIETVLAKHMPKEHSAGIFSSYMEHPTGVTFQSQEKDEMILLFLRRHWITNIPWVIATIALLLLPPLFVFFFTTFRDELLPMAITIPLTYTIIFFLFYYLIIFGYVFVSFISWFYNAGIVTQQRIVDIDYSDVVYRNIAVTKLVLVEDVNYTQSGFLRSLFNYGDVFIQTAGTHVNFEFPKVPQPARAVHIIQDLIGKGSDVR